MEGFINVRKPAIRFCMGNYLLRLAFWLVLSELEGWLVLNRNYDVGNLVNIFMAPRLIVKNSVL